MERLTRRMCGGWGLVEGCEINSPGGMRRIVERLAAYENTGLEPQEVEQIKGYLEPFTIQDMNRFREIMQAEKNGHLVILPCLKGDVLWTYYNYLAKGVYSLSVVDVAVLNGAVLLNTDRCGVISPEDVGKTVFLTREEAEAAMKRREVQL